MPNKVSDGSEQGANILFTRLVRCELEGEVIFVTGQSNNYRRNGALTLAYARELRDQLSAILARIDAAPVFDGIDLQLAGEAVTFSLKSGGLPVASGSVTRDVAERALAWLGEHFDPTGGKVVPMKRRGG